MIGGGWWLAVPTVAVMMLGGSEPVGAAPSPAADPIDSYRAVLSIDTSQVDSAGPTIERRLEERMGPVVGDDTWVQVVVVEVRGDEPGFAFELRVEHRGEAIGEPQRVECGLCTESELVDRLEAALLEALERGPSTRAVAPGPPPPPSGAYAPSGPPPPRGPRPRPSGRARLSGSAIAGIGLLTAGAAGAGVGLGLTLRAPRVRPRDPRFVVDTRPAGIAVLASAGAALVLGTALLARSPRVIPRSVAVGPWLYRGGVAVATRLRF